MKTSEKKLNRNLKKFAILTLGGISIALFVALVLQYDKNEELKNQSIQNQYALQEDYMDELMLIEHNLNQIIVHKNETAEAITEGFDQDDIHERIINEIQIIESLMDENLSMIEALNQEIGDNNVKLARAEKDIKKAQSQLANMQNELAKMAKENEELLVSIVFEKSQNKDLREELQWKDQQIKELVERTSDSKAQLAEQRALIEELNEKYSTAYYVVGSFKELKEEEIVEKNGGVLGIGATKQLRPDFNTDPFIGINKYEYRTIPVFSKKAELISQHDPNSYEWVKEDKEIMYLEIKEPSAFWKQSSFLIIETKDGMDLELAMNK